MPEAFETMMLILFGMSWPISITKSYKSRTAKGKSLFFLLLILFGYACGTVSKFISGRLTYVVAFYIINLIAVSVDTMLYFRNRRLDALKG